MSFFYHLLLPLFCSAIINTFVSDTPAMKPPMRAVNAIGIAVNEPTIANTI
jgi:hypothetical protein